MLTAAIAVVHASTIAARASCAVTRAIGAIEPAFTPSRKASATGELRIRGTSGPLRATMTKAGRKIPTVATTAPQKPPST